MPNSIDYYQKQVNDVFAQYPALEELMKNTEPTSVFFALRNAIAVQMQLNATNFEEDIEVLRAEKSIQPLATLAWYIDKVKQFRIPEGVNKGAYQLRIDHRFIPDYTSQILALPPSLDKVSIQENTQLSADYVEQSAPGNLLIKVLKPNRQTLSNVELGYLTQYSSDIRTAGLTIQIISYEPCKIWLDSASKLVIGIDGALLDRDSALDLVHSTIGSFLDNYKFDDVLNLDKVIDALQAVDGFQSVYLAHMQFAQRNYDDSAFIGTFEAQSLRSVPGHFEYDAVKSKLSDDQIVTRSS